MGPRGAQTGPSLAQGHGLQGPRAQGHGPQGPMGLKDLGPRGRGLKDPGPRDISLKARGLQGPEGAPPWTPEGPFKEPQKAICYHFNFYVFYMIFMLRKIGTSICGYI